MRGPVAVGGGFRGGRVGGVVVLGKIVVVAGGDGVGADVIHDAGEEGRKGGAGARAQEGESVGFDCGRPVCGGGVQGVEEGVLDAGRRLVGGVCGRKELRMQEGGSERV